VIRPELASNIYQILFFPKKAHNLGSEKRRRTNFRQNGANLGNYSQSKALENYPVKEGRSLDLTADGVDERREIAFRFAL
jgi:hypothetical protein